LLGQQRRQQEREEKAHQSLRGVDGKQMGSVDQSGDGELYDHGDLAESDKASEKCSYDGGDELDDTELGEAFGNGEAIVPDDDDSDTGGDLSEGPSGVRM
jgi:hypothetical protein